MDNRRLVTRLEGFSNPTVWSEFTPLAQECKAVNLGQGFPSWDAAPFVKDALCHAVRDGHNQYCRSAGAPQLVKALAERYSAELDHTVDAMSEVVVSNGATEAIFAALQAHVEIGDEVIVFEPAFDIYPAQIQMAGGIVRRVPLKFLEPTDGRPPTSRDFSFDLEVFAGVLNTKTKLVLLNSPHNPTGKVFSREELASIAGALQKFPEVVVLSDEVYELQIYDNTEFVRFATLPGMWDRTMTVSSAGKMFSITGWKIGWVIGPRALIKPIMLAQQWVQFSVSTPSQVAVGSVLTTAAEPYGAHANYYDFVREDFTQKRDVLARVLREAGITPIVPEGGFFIMGETTELEVPAAHLKEGMSRDWALCRWLTTDVGVSAIPPSAFYSADNKHLAANLARFAFCKGNDDLEEAGARLKKLAR